MNALRTLAARVLDRLAEWACIGIDAIDWTFPDDREDER